MLQPPHPLFAYPPTSNYLAERDTSLSNLRHLNHKSLHGVIVLKAKKSPMRRPAQTAWPPATYGCKSTVVWCGEDGVSQGTVTTDW